jgi:hypothetical protein
MHSRYARKLCNPKLKRIFSKPACVISKILFILGWYNFLAYLEYVRSCAWSKGHSDPDLSSVQEHSTMAGQLISLTKKQGVSGKNVDF